MCAYTERRYAFSLGIFLDFNRFIYIKAIAEHNLLGAGINIQAAIFVDYKVKFPEVVAAVHSEPFE